MEDIKDVKPLLPFIPVEEVPTTTVVDIGASYKILPRSTMPLDPPDPSEGASMQRYGKHRLIMPPTTKYHAQQVGPTYQQMYKIPNEQLFKSDVTLVAFPRMIMDVLWSISKRTWYYYNYTGRYLEENDRTLIFVAAKPMSTHARLEVGQKVRLYNSIAQHVYVEIIDIPMLLKADVNYYYGIVRVL